MNPVIFSLGPLEVRAFTGWIALGVLAFAAAALITARRLRHPLLPWLDACIGGLVGGVIGARAAHVWLNWAYFSVHRDEILAFQGGGLDWHGAVVGGLLGAALVAVIRRVPLPALFDAFALAVPVGAAAIWQGCAASACGYGLEVRTLADHPAWLVVESPDVYGSIAPRLNLPVLGTALAAALFALMAVLTALGWLRGLRLWLALIIYGLSMAVLGFFRAEYVPTWLGLRADQVLDLAVAAVAAGCLTLSALVALSQRRATSGVVSP